MTILLRQKPLTQVVRQIVQRDNGAWFDPSDMSTMFQDAAGTIPVTAMEQPVGKWLDKSGNGNHATQSITASRPTLSARYNLLTKTEDFADAAWFKLFVSVSTTNEIPPINFGSKSSIITPTATSQVFTEIYQNSPIYAGSTYTQSYVVKSNGYQYIQIIGNAGAFGSSYINFDIISGETFSVGNFSGSSKYIENGWYIITCSATAIASSSTRLSLNFINSLTSTRGSVFNGDGYSGIFLASSQLNIGTATLKYQSVNTATDYDSVGWPKYIKAEGVDDHFVLPYLGLYNNASCSIITSHSSSSQAANGVIVSEASSTDADTKYLPYRQLASAGNVDSYIAADNAAVILDSTGAAYSGTKENIIESIIDSGTSIETYRSGVLLSNEPYTRSATLTLNNTTLFGSVSTTNTNFLNTKLYGLIITKSNLSARDRSLCETYLKSKVQVLQV